MHKWSGRQNNGNHPNRTAKRKTNLKTWKHFKRSLEQQVYQHSHYRGPRRRRERKGYLKCIWGNYSWQLPKPEERNRYPEAQRVPNKMNPNRPTPRHIIIKMAKVKVRILKAMREKQRVIQGNPHKAITRFLCRNSAGRKRVPWYIQSP